MKKIIGVVLLLLSLNVNSALVSRLGGLAVYDTDIDVTWTAEANLASKNTFGVSNINPNGSMNGHTADEWITGMNAFNGTGYLGVDSWRLTNLQCFDIAQNNCTSSEFGHLFYIELSGTALSPISESGDPDLELFINIVENNWYWSGSYLEGHVEVFNFGNGYNSRTFPNLAHYQVWAVSDGDVFASTIPIPSAVWLFGSGLIGLIGFAKHNI